MEDSLSETKSEIPLEDIEDIEKIKKSGILYNEFYTKEYNVGDIFIFIYKKNDKSDDEIIESLCEIEEFTYKKPTERKGNEKETTELETFVFFFSFPFLLLLFLFVFFFFFF